VLQTIASSNVVQGTMFAHVHEEIEQVKLHLMDKSLTDKAGTFKFRKEVEGLVKSIATLESNKRININAENRLELNRKLGELKHLTDFAPIWVILTISVLGLPVSTTHVLSSGIAGSMVASGGKSNLNKGTLKSIGLAWVLTLPVSIGLALLLFIFFHLFI